MALQQFAENFFEKTRKSSETARSTLLNTELLLSHFTMSSIKTLSYSERSLDNMFETEVFPWKLQTNGLVESSLLPTAY
jgi:hypothetical protein